MMRSVVRSLIATALAISVDFSSAFISHHLSCMTLGTSHCARRHHGIKSISQRTRRTTDITRRGRDIGDPGKPKIAQGVLQMGGEDVKESGVVGDQSEAKGDPRLYSVRVSRVTGIDWGTDLSFKWVYVRALEPSGSGAQAGVAVGDQLIAVNDNNLTGATFDAAMGAMTTLEGPDVEFTFFRGSQEELKTVVGADSPPQQITITVKQKGKEDIVLKAPPGTNLRNILTENDINVYQSFTRWTNCKGKQLCGTCIVEINEGLESCTVRSIDESSTLRDNPANYRLSCVTNMYDDVTVTVFPPIGAAQWTR